MAVTAKHSAGRTKPYSRFMSQIAEENKDVMDRRKQAVLDGTASVPKKRIPESQLRAMGSTNRKNLIPVNGVKQAASKQSTINRNRQTEERIGTKANRTRREIENAYIQAVVDRHNKKKSQK